MTPWENIQISVKARNVEKRARWLESWNFKYFDWTTGEYERFTRHTLYTRLFLLIHLNQNVKPLYYKKQTTFFYRLKGIAWTFAAVIDRKSMSRWSIFSRQNVKNFPEDTRTYVKTAFWENNRRWCSCVFQ